MKKIKNAPIVAEADNAMSRVSGLIEYEAMTFTPTGCPVAGLPIGTVVTITEKGVEVQRPRGAYQDHGVGPTLRAAIESIG